MGRILLAMAGAEIAWALTASVAVLVGLAALLVWLGRRRARRAFQTRLKGYKTKAVAMMDRLDGLKARLKTLPIEDRDFSKPMAGDTLALYEKTGDDLRKLWDRWLEVMDVVDRAEGLDGKGAAGVRRGDALVSDAKVFEEVEAAAVSCSRSMDVLNSAHGDAAAAAKAAGEARARAAGRVGALAAAELPTDPYRPETDRIAAAVREADAILVADPLGAKAAYDRAAADADALAGRAADVAARHDDAAKVRDDLAALRADVAARRRDGLRLDEDGGDPDGPAALADQALADLRSALEAGDPAEAAAKLAEARDALDRGRAALAAVVAARDAVVKGLPEARREARRLAEALPQYAAFEAELRRDFNDDSWRDVAGNLTQARTLLETFDRKADEIGNEVDPQTQKHLLASRLLGRLVREQAAVFRLMNAVGERLSALKEVRDRARRLSDELGGLDRDVGGFFRRNDAIVGPQARASLRAAGEANREAARLVASPRPDWPEALKALTTAREEYAAARSRAQSDADVHRVMRSEYDEARRTATRVGALLDGGAADRPAANQRYRRAVEALDLAEGGAAGAEWSDLLARVRDARGDLKRAEELAREDIRLARQAEAEIAEAARTIREGRGFLSMGVGVDASAAESLLTRAQSLYHGKDYEQAVQTAGAAVQQARQARREAERRAGARRAVAVQPPGPDDART